MAIIPVAKALYLCEETDVEGGSINLYALLGALRPPSYPYTHPSFTCFAQLLGGFGRLSCYVDVRRADDLQLVRNTNVVLLDFPDRTTLRQVAINVEGCVFESPGLYLIELYCDNTWVADTVLLLREVQP